MSERFAPEYNALFEHTDNHSGAFLTVYNKEMDFSPRKEIR